MLQFIGVGWGGRREGRGDEQFEEDGRRGCVEKVLSKFTNIQKQKAHLSNKNDYIFIWQKVVYT